MSNSTEEDDDPRSQNNEKRSRREFPRFTLAKALEIPAALKEKNAGNPWDPKEVARAVDISQKSTNFLFLVNSARDYGLIEGAARGGSISLTDLGRQAIYPESPEEEQRAKLAAFLKVELFQRVLKYYKGSNLPDKIYLENTLIKEFSVPKELHEDFLQLYRENCRFCRIGGDFEGLSGPGISSAAPKGTSISLTVPGTPVAKGDKLCFIIMPFVERDEQHPTGFFDEVLRSLFIPAAEAAGFVARTASREGSDVIQSTIINDLLKADLVLADLTEHNPNVLFELGMRMCEDKPVALVKAKGTGRIFDVDNMLRVLEYNPNLWPTTVSKDLSKITDHIKAAWDRRDTGDTYMKILRRGVVQSVDLIPQYSKG